MYICNSEIQLENRSFQKGDFIQDNLVTRRMLDLNLVRKVKENAKPSETKTSQKNQEKPKKTEGAQILTENSSKVEVLKEDVKETKDVKDVKETKDVKVK